MGYVLTAVLLKLIENAHASGYKYVCRPMCICAVHHNRVPLACFPPLVCVTVGDSSTVSFAEAV